MTSNVTKSPHSEISSGFLSKRITEYPGFRAAVEFIGKCEDRYWQMGITGLKQR